MVRTASITVARALTVTSGVRVILRRPIPTYPPSVFDVASIVTSCLQENTRDDFGNFCEFVRSGGCSLWRSTLRLRCGPIFLQIIFVHLDMVPLQKVRF